MKQKICLAVLTLAMAALLAAALTGCQSAPSFPWTPAKAAPETPVPSGTLSPTGIATALAAHRATATARAAASSTAEAEAIEAARARSRPTETPFPAWIAALGTPPAKSFELVTIPDHFDRNGDGKPEIAIRWDTPGRPLLQIFMTEGKAFRLVGEMDPAWQMISLADFDPTLRDTPAAGWRGYLVPNPPDNPERWQIYGWNGERFALGKILPRPGGAQPTAMGGADPLPALPAELFFQREGAWYRIPQTGGAPERVEQAPPEPPYCRNNPSNCRSPGKRYELVETPVNIEVSVVGVKDRFTGKVAEIQDTGHYVSGYNSFAWSPDGNFLLHAGAPLGASLDRVNPANGKEEKLFHFNPCGADPMYACIGESQGAADPVVFKDGSVAFSIQSDNLAAYPPPGIYRRSPGGELARVVELPPLTQACRGGNGEDPIYGKVAWSPDGAFFLYQGPGPDPQPFCASTIILGKADGTAAWDLSGRLQGAAAFRWGGE